MNSANLGLVAAMPEEINPLLQLIGSHKKEKCASFDCYRFDVNGKAITLIRSGMGVSRAATATKVLIEMAQPSLIINFGFAGAVTTGPKVGDLVLARQIFGYDGHSFRRSAPTADLAPLVKTSGGAILNSTFITTRQIIEKSMLARIVPEGCLHPTVEMESAAVAEIAAKAGIPFAAIRAISDAADEELGFSLDEFTDHDLNIRIGRVLKTVAKKPWIIPQLLRLARNSRIAGKNLAGGLKALLEVS